jgi:hypothetical protein
MNIAIIDTKIEILKIKIAYRRKLVILQNLRSEDAGDKSKFYIFIEEEIPSVFKKRAQFSSVNISSFQRPKANPPPIYSEASLKDYHNYIEKCSLYFKNHTRVFLTETEKITYTAIFTKDISRNK